MKKLILVPPVLLLSVLMTFFSCTKDAPVPGTEQASLNPQISMEMGENGIMNVKITNPSTRGGVAEDRDGETLCTMYEALRFTEPPAGGSGTVDPTARVNVYIEFRLIKIDKSTGAITGLTNYTWAYGQQGVSGPIGVGGLNISWYQYPPLSNEVYAIGIRNCTRAVPKLGDQTFIINDFWSDDYMVHLDPWDPANRDAYDVEFGPITSASPDVYVAKVELLEDCDLDQVW